VAPNKLMLGEIKPDAKMKIKAMGGDDEDEQPKLIDVDVAKRASAKSGKGSKAAKGSKGPKAESSSKAPNTLKASKPAETKGEPAKAGKAAAPAVVAEPVSKPAKPKLRLNPKTGKLEPAGQAGLF